MGKRILVNGKVVEINDETVVRTLENGKVVSKRYGDIKKKEPTPTSVSNGNASQIVEKAKKATNSNTSIIPNNPFGAVDNKPAFGAEAQKEVINKQVSRVTEKFKNGTVTSKDIENVIPYNRELAKKIVKTYIPNATDDIVFSGEVLSGIDNVNGAYKTALKKIENNNATKKDFEEVAKYNQPAALDLYQKSYGVTSNNIDDNFILLKNRERKIAAADGNYQKYKDVAAKNGFVLYKDIQELTPEQKAESFRFNGKVKYLNAGNEEDLSFLVEKLQKNENAMIELNRPKYKMSMSGAKVIDYEKTFALSKEQIEKNKFDKSVKENLTRTVGNVSLQNYLEKNNKTLSELTEQDGREIAQKQYALQNPNKYAVLKSDINNDKILQSSKDKDGNIDKIALKAYYDSKDVSKDLEDIFINAASSYAIEKGLELPENIKQIKNTQIERFPEIADKRIAEKLASYNYKKTSWYQNDHVKQSDIDRWANNPEFASIFSDAELNRLKTGAFLQKNKEYDLFGNDVAILPSSGIYESLEKGLVNGFVPLYTGVRSFFSDEYKRDRILNETKNSDLYLDKTVGDSQEAAQEFSYLEQKKNSANGLTETEKKEYDNLYNELHAQSDISKWVDKMFNTVGMVAGQALGTKGVGLVGKAATTALVGKNAIIGAEMLAQSRGITQGLSTVKNVVSGATFASATSYSDIAKEAMLLFPDDKGKQRVFLGLNLAATAGTEYMFRDTKVLDAFNTEIRALITNFVRNVRPSDITDAAVNNLLQTSTLKFVGRYAKEMGIENTKETVEETSTQLVNSISKIALGDKEYDVEKAFKDIGNTAKETFISTPIVSALAARTNIMEHGYGRKNIYNAAVNAKSYLKEVDRQEKNNEITPQEASTSRFIIEQAGIIQKNEPSKVASLSLGKKATYLTNTLNVKLLEKKLENKNLDDNERKDIEAEIAISKKNAELIYNGTSTVSDRYATDEESEVEAIQNKNEALRDRIAQQPEMLEALRDNLKAATTDEERKVIQKQIDEVEKTQTKDVINLPITEQGGLIPTGKKIFTDFDETLWDNKNQKLTPLGEEMKAKIASGEDITILTARVDKDGKDTDFIAEKLGISKDKIKTDLSPEQKASNLTRGSVFYDDNEDNIAEAKNKLFPFDLEGDTPNTIDVIDSKEVNKNAAPIEKDAALPQKNEKELQANIVKIPTITKNIFDDTVEQHKDKIPKLSTVTNTPIGRKKANELIDEYNTNIQQQANEAAKIAQKESTPKTPGTEEANNTGIAISSTQNDGTNTNGNVSEAQTSSRSQENGKRLSEIKGKDVLYNGKQGVLNQTDTGEWVVETDDKDIIIPTKDKNNPELSNELGIEVLSDITEQQINEAKADKEQVGYVTSNNGNEFFVSLANPKIENTVGDQVFLKDKKGKLKEVSGMTDSVKLGIINKFLNEKGLPNRKQLTKVEQTTIQKKQSKDDGTKPTNNNKVDAKVDNKTELEKQPTTSNVGVEEGSGGVELKNEGKAEVPTLENIDSRLRLGHPFYEKVSDALNKLGIIKKYNPETKEGDIIGGFSQKTSDGGFKVGKIEFKKDGSISYIDGFNIIEFDKNGNVISENTKEVKAIETQNTISSLKESISNFENIRDSEAFKYKEKTNTDLITGQKTKVKILKTSQELKESTDKINIQIEKSKAELKLLEQSLKETTKEEVQGSGGVVDGGMDGKFYSQEEIKAHSENLDKQYNDIVEPIYQKYKDMGIPENKILQNKDAYKEIIEATKQNQLEENRLKNHNEQLARKIVNDVVDKQNIPDGVKKTIKKFFASDSNSPFNITTKYAKDFFNPKGVERLAETMSIREAQAEGFDYNDMPSNAKVELFNKNLEVAKIITKDIGNKVAKGYEQSLKETTNKENIVSKQPTSIEGKQETDKGESDLDYIRQEVKDAFVEGQNNKGVKVGESVDASFTRGLQHIKSDAVALAIIRAGFERGAFNERQYNDIGIDLLALKKDKKGKVDRDELVKIIEKFTKSIDNETETITEEPNSESVVEGIESKAESTSEVEQAEAIAEADALIEHNIIEIPKKKSRTKKVVDKVKEIVGLKKSNAKEIKEDFLSQLKNIESIVFDVHKYPKEQQEEMRKQYLNGSNNPFFMEDEIISSLKEKGYEINEDGKVTILVKDDGIFTFVASDIVNIIDNVSKRFPSNDKLSVISSSKAIPSKKKSAYYDYALNRGSVERNQQYVDTAQYNVDEANKVLEQAKKDGDTETKNQAESLLEIFNKDLEEQKAILEYAKNIDYEVENTPNIKKISSNLRVNPREILNALKEYNLEVTQENAEKILFLKDINDNLGGLEKAENRLLMERGKADLALQPFRYANGKEGYKKQSTNAKIAEFNRLKNALDEIDAKIKYLKQVGNELSKIDKNNKEELPFSIGTPQTKSQIKAVQKIIDYISKGLKTKIFAPFSEFETKLKELGYSSLQAMVDAKSNGLIAIHNLNPRSILNANNLGGIPMPSIAITSVNNIFDSFGSISLIGKKALIDPKQSRDNKVFASDVYSARYPSITYVRKGYTDTSLFADKERESIAANSIGNDIENGGFDRMSSNTYMKQMYLISKGIKVPLVFKSKEISTKYINKFKKLGLDKLQHWQLKESKEFNDLALEYFKENNSQETIIAGKFIIDGQLNNNLVNNYAYTFISDAKEFTDEYETSKKVDKIIEKNIDGYNEFAKKQYEKAKVEEKIFKGFTNSGYRRYVPHTLANVIKEMKADGVRNGEKFGYGAGSVRATITKQFKSVQDIINSKEKLVDEKEFESVKDEINKELIELLEEIKPFYKYSGGFGYYDDAGTQLSTIANIGQSESFNKLPIESQNKVADFLNKLQNAPTQYFEAKITRPVSISEFDTALVPKVLPQNVLQILKDSGLNVVTYDGKEDRQQKVKEVSEKRQIQFLKKPNGAVLGFVSEGKIYLNPNALTAETVWHELSHIQQQVIRSVAKEGDEAAQKILNRWERIAKDNDIVGQIRKDKKVVIEGKSIPLDANVYEQSANETDAEYEQRILDEVWAYLVSPEAQKQWKKASKYTNKIKGFIEAISNYFKEKLGYKGNKNIQNSTLDELILSGANSLLKKEYLSDKELAKKEQKIDEQQLNTPVTAFSIAQGEGNLTDEDKVVLDEYKQYIKEGEYASVQDLAKDYEINEGKKLSQDAIDYIESKDTSNLTKSTQNGNGGNKPPNNDGNGDVDNEQDDDSSQRKIDQEKLNRLIDGIGKNDAESSYDSILHRLSVGLVVEGIADKNNEAVKKQLTDLAITTNHTEKILTQLELIYGEKYLSKAIEIVNNIKNIEQLTGKFALGVAIENDIAQIRNGVIENKYDISVSDLSNYNKQIQNHNVKLASKASSVLNISKTLYNYYGISQTENELTTTEEDARIKAIKELLADETKIEKAADDFENGVVDENTKVDTSKNDSKPKKDKPKRGTKTKTEIRKILNNLKEQLKNIDCN